jgi:hypothetical protein
MNSEGRASAIVIITYAPIVQRYGETPLDPRYPLACLPLPIQHDISKGGIYVVPLLAFDRSFQFALS